MWCIVFLKNRLFIKAKGKPELAYSRGGVEGFVIEMKLTESETV